MTASEKIYEGSCLCGAVRFRVEGALGPMTHCHCTDCQKVHGAAFATYVEIPKDRFRFIQGADRLRTHTAESGTRRAFCTTCGSIMTSEVDSDPGEIYVPAGTMDTPPTGKGEYHIFVRSRAPWFEIRDGLPQHEDYPKE